MASVPFISNSVCLPASAAELTAWTPLFQLHCRLTSDVVCVFHTDAGFLLRNRAECQHINDLISYVRQPSPRLSIITLRAKLSGAVYCYRSCLWLWCLQRACGRCPNLTTASARAVFASLWALFHLTFLLSASFCQTQQPTGPWWQLMEYCLYTVPVTAVHTYGGRTSSIRLMIWKHKHVCKVPSVEAASMKKKRAERRKHCALAVVGQSRKISPRHRPTSRRRRTAKI